MFPQNLSGSYLLLVLRLSPIPTLQYHDPHQFQSMMLDLIHVALGSSNPEKVICRIQGEVVGET
jgi:hypothetical protein